ncbi:Hpt domain-containing protein [Paenarthrobacter sp. NPDC058040]|uniref:Hpt domain-containing protein n=1 Tax=unclassified Paenarthrobacter TaxID=2634190 RepID=UPI0036DE9ADF
MSDPTGRTAPAPESPDGPGNEAHVTAGPALELPSLEVRTLRALAEELGDSKPVLRLLSTYLTMLPSRILRISRGLVENDADASMEAVLSLKISSAMVGARETENQCRAMEHMIREDHIDYAVQALPALQQYTERCVAARPQLLGRARETLGRESLDCDL